MENFDSLNLDPAVLRSIKELGYEKPSPIQAQTLPILLGEDVDFVGLAATGTGKTAAFVLPLLKRINPKKAAVQAIILCPTRELCIQVTEQVQKLGKYLGVRALPIYGGTGYEDQWRGLRAGVPVIVGTPGLVIDHLERGSLKLDDVKVVVLDEADEMISMGFREDMETILEGVPREASNTWLFSATMSPLVRGVADHFLREPRKVQVNRTEMLSATVEQVYYMTQEANKPEVLCKLMDAVEDFYGVIFCQTKELVVNLTRYLSERGYRVDQLHGDMNQQARESAMMAFRQKRVRVLVCTDVASRGLDVKDMTHVVNYSLPRELDIYVHRIGRTARSGKTGIAMSLVTPSHRALVMKIERLTKSKLIEGQVPTRKEIGIKKIGRMLSGFNEQTAYVKAMDLMDDSWKAAVENMSSKEVAARFLAMMFPWVFSDERQPGMARSAPGPVARANPSTPPSSQTDRRERPRFGGGPSKFKKKPKKYETHKRFAKGEQKSRPKAKHESAR